jgi:hypothetical protein
MCPDMHVPPVHVEHPEVQLIQPTWHCLLRFRQRATLPPGGAAALEGLRALLADATIDRIAPSWAAGQEAPLWAVCDDFAFPLTPAGMGTTGVWSALTCLRRATG